VKSNYKLSYLPLFEEDLLEILDYITYKLNSPKAATDLLDDVEKAIFERLSYPEAFETYPSYKERAHRYYRIYVKNFIIYYVVINDKYSVDKIVEIRRILYNGRNHKKLI
jgi:plasmid stabilization system protein ParE